MEHIKDLKGKIEEADRFAIIAHFNPDGDAVGSSLAVYHLLQKLDKKASVIMPNEYPDFLHWMPGHREVLYYDSAKEQVEKVVNEADVIFCLDFNHLTRIQELGTVVHKSKAFKVMVDHHQSPDNFPDLTFHDDKASSTAELIYELIVGMDYKELVDKDLASCVYTGLLTDTGSFQYSSTSPQVHRIAADLLDTGLDGYKIYDRIFNSYNENRLRFFGYCWNERLELLAGGKAAIMGVGKSDQLKFNLKKGDTEGLVNTPLQINGVVISVFAKVHEKIVKLSFRSKGEIDVNKLARAHFNGGGHVNAAGGKMEIPLEDVMKMLREIIPEFLKEYKIEQ